MRLVSVNGEPVHTTAVEQLLQLAQSQLSVASQPTPRAGDWWVCTKTSKPAQIYRGQVVRVVNTAPVLDWGLAWEGQSPDRLLDPRTELGGARFARIDLHSALLAEIEEATCVRPEEVPRAYQGLLFRVGSKSVSLRVAGEVSDYNCMIQGRNEALVRHRDLNARLRSRVKNNIATIKRLQEAREELKLLHPIPSHLNVEQPPPDYARLPVFKTKQAFALWYGGELGRYSHESVLVCLHRARDAGRCSYSPAMHAAMAVTNAEVRDIMDDEGGTIFHGVNPGGIFATSAAASLAQFAPSDARALQAAQKDEHWDGGNLARGWTFALLYPKDQSLECGKLVNRERLEQLVADR